MHSLEISTYSTSNSLRDVILSKAMEEGLMPRSEWKLWIHPFLEHLNLSQYGSHVSDSLVEKLILPNIKEQVEIDSWEDISDHSISASQLYGGIPALKSLVLSNCIKVDTFMIERILSECQNLLHLDISRNSNIKKIVIDSPKLLSLVSK